MAKVTKKQLGRRRRGALLVLLILLGLMIYLICRCCRKPEDTAPADAPAEAEQSAEESAPAVTTIPGILYQGTIALFTEADPGQEEEVLPVREEPLPTACQLDVEPVLQNPELPTGCEITSLTMALNYLGYAVDKRIMADNYLICAEPYEATFGEAFIGSPYDPNSWGCYAPVIVETAEKFIADQGGSEYVQNLTGSSLEDLFWEVAEGTPVIIWATIGMTSDVEERYYWTTADGDDAVFISGEHCLLLTGYDLEENTVIVCDPLEGCVSYDRDVFEDRFQIMYQQAVVIREK